MFKMKRIGLFILLNISLSLICVAQVKELQIKYNFEDGGASWQAIAELRAYKSKELFEITNKVHMGPTQSDPAGVKKEVKTYIYKDREKGVMVSREVALTELFVKDKLDLFKWNLQNEKIKILGYECQKATASYRGREYVAYFTTDLPYKAAPWKFHGLPGVVLNAYSTDNYLKMEATEVAIKETRLPIVNVYVGLKHITWGEFVDIYKESITKLIKLRKAKNAKMGAMGESFDKAPSNIEIIMEGNEMTAKEQAKILKSAYESK
jgi:GLPGLI family protein